MCPSSLYYFLVFLSIFLSLFIKKNHERGSMPLLLSIHDVAHSILDAYISFKPLFKSALLGLLAVSTP